MTTAQQLLMEGMAAVKRRDYDEGERLLMGAFKAYPPNDGGRRTACIGLGRIYRQTGRYEDAIAVLERGLPYPAAFSELVAIYRFLGKVAKKEGDTGEQGECYRKMYSLSKICQVVTNLRVGKWTHGVDWERGAKWIDDIAAQCGTIYAYQFEGEEIDRDTLLSEADYRVLRSLC